MPKKSRKARAGKAVAGTKKLPKRNASAVAKGAAYAVLAGRPVKASRGRRGRQNRIRAVLGCEGGSSRHHNRGTVRPIQGRPEQSQEVVGRIDGREQKSGSKVSMCESLRALGCGKRPRAFC
jgi:hypothetical protein